MDVGDFITRWEATQASERANKDSFLKELCRVLGVPEPDGKTGDPRRDVYVFEADARLLDEDGRPSIGSMDLYRRGCFVLEAKQGSASGKRIGTARRGTPGWNSAMTEAMGQAFGYARTLDDPPPFVIIADIGYCFDLYAAFDGTGAYRAFPNAQKNRIMLRDLPRHLDQFRAIWLDPLSLDPRRHAERVTRDVAERLAGLARELEESGHAPEVVARFLMRCLFTMFAEDIGLLRDHAFTDALARRWIPEPATFKDGVENLWEAMNEGKRFFLLGKLLHFNGGLFREPTALPLTQRQLELVHDAARCNWADVEPAIFGTLIERALDPHERHRLGAHFTPRAFVERLLVPAIEEPLRAEWDLIRAQLRALVPPNEATKPAAVRKAQDLVRAFQRRLCSLRVLDPACGSGNFLYVALDFFKRLESDVLKTLYDLGVTQGELGEDVLVTPKQFIGLELRRSSKEIAELVLWIGYLQWHHRTYGGTKTPPEPVLRDYQNVDPRDAVLAYDRVEPVRDGKGAPLTKWDGVTRKRNRTTGEYVPDESARVAINHYINPRIAPWPDADFIVGNPPFMGGWKIRQTRGDGYVAALWATYPHVPEKADYVMYWWDRAAEAVRTGAAISFGLITTNSVGQVFQRRVVQRHTDTDDRPLRIAFAIADHPWVNSEDAAAVRVAMTVGTRNAPTCRLGEVVQEHADGRVDIAYREVERINADLTFGASVVETRVLRANAGLCSPGVQLYGAGFVVDAAEYARLARGVSPTVARRILRPYMNGRDFIGKRRECWVIDFFGLDEKAARKTHPLAFQRVLERVKPERDQNRREPIREIWWRFGWERPVWRTAVAGLQRFIATPETSKHRVFTFLDADVLPDNMLTNFATDDAFVLGVLSSRVHVAWALSAGGTLEDRPRYNKTVCFDPFPFPDPPRDLRHRVADLAEQLDEHRARVLRTHPDLTLTAMYNVLDKLRAGSSLTGKERSVCDRAFVAVLRKLHDDLDAAVLAAYGWPEDVTADEIVAKLVALNGQRAAEEQRGLIRWLRADFQKDQGGATRTRPARTPRPDTATLSIPWPTDLPTQVSAVRGTLAAAPAALSAAEVAAVYDGARPALVIPVLRTLEALGLAAAFGEGDERRWRGLAKAVRERVESERPAGAAPGMPEVPYPAAPPPQMLIAADSARGTRPPPRR